MKRRDFLKNTAVFVSGASLSLSALDFIDPQELPGRQPEAALGLSGQHPQVRGVRFLREGLQDRE